MRIKFAVLLQCILLHCTHSVRAVNIEMVTVGNPGNAPDPTTGFGRVDYEYQIGKYEITAGQYTAFLNAVAKADPNGLYHVGMQLLILNGAHIQQSGSSPNYGYSVAPDWADRPVNFVSTWNAARFCNWLHNGQPTGPQGPGTTEDGAYHGIGNEALFGRNPDAKYFIPTENEWYKAAYHNKAAGLLADYFEYPTRTNAVPGVDFTEITSPGNNANVVNAIGAPYWRTEVGDFELSSSSYGSFDQGGNVWEWTETKALEEPLHFYWIFYRGGAYDFSPITLHASFRNRTGFGTVSEDLGFRIAAAAPVPEPTSLALFSIAAVMLGGSRFRTRLGNTS